jgi:hypothetical protein
MSITVDQVQLVYCKNNNKLGKYKYNSTINNKFRNPAPHLDTHSAHSSSAQVLKEAAVAGCRKKEEREACFLVLDILCCLVHYLGIVLAIYIKEVLLGFVPLEGFLG